LNTTPETIPSYNSYLVAPSDLKKEWEDRFGSWKKFRIGIAWAGSPTHKNDRHRSIDASLFRPITEMPDVLVCSLQIGKDGEAAEQFGDGITDLAPALTDFSETAAAINQLDLVISVDTAVAHLAGALGHPVWTLLPFIPDWRWLLERDDSPWYRSMRLFRQKERGDWKGTVETIQEALLKELNNHPR
jgi:ADP-heptose:LPS heptosyltransferase